MIQDGGYIGEGYTVLDQPLPAPSSCHFARSEDQLVTRERERVKDPFLFPADLECRIDVKPTASISLHEKISRF